MVVLKHGDRYINKTGEMTCKICGCKFVYSPGDVRVFHDPKEIVTKEFVNCPECLYTLQINKED